MADPSDGSFNLKHRLVGATVLIVIAVILLPRVLTGTTGESTPTDGDISRAAPNTQPVEYSRVPKADLGAGEDLIKTVRGKGYLLVPPANEKSAEEVFAGAD